MAVTERDLERSARAAVQRIEADLGIANILRELEELPGLIRQQQEAVRAARQAVEEAKTNVENAEAILTALISDEKDYRTGKARFSNDTARKAELTKRKTTDPTYLEAAKGLAMAEEAASSAQFDLDLLLNRFAAVRSVAGLTTQRLRILGGDN